MSDSGDPIPLQPTTGSEWPATVGPTETAATLPHLTGAADAAAPLGRLGDFDLLADAGRDGPFVLLRARQARLNRPVLLKVLPGDADTHGPLAEALRREAASAAGLNHPGVLPLLESGEIGGRPYLALAAVEGETLAERLARGPVRNREAAEWIRQLAETLFVVHQRGVLHTNLRPEFVHIGRDGQVRLSGFGSADRTEPPTGYLVPERVPGHGRGPDRRSDVYGVGALLYAMLTGHPPHAAADPDELREHIRRHDVLPACRRRAGASRELSAVAAKCLRGEPFRRYPHLGPVIAEVRCFLANKPVRARSGLWWRGPVMWLRRNRRVLATLLIVVLGLTLPTGWGRLRDQWAWAALLPQPVSVWLTLQPEAARAASGAELHCLKDGSILASGPTPLRDVFTLTATAPAGVRAITEVRLEALRDPSLPAGGPGRAENGNFALTDLRLRVGAAGAERPVALSGGLADHAQDGFPARAAVDEDANGTGWAVGGALGQPHTAEFTTTQRVPVAPGERLMVTLSFGSHDRHQLGRFRLAIRPDDGDRGDASAPASWAVAHFERRHRDRPADDLVRAGLALARARIGEGTEALRLLYVTDADGYYPGRRQASTSNPNWGARPDYVTPAFNGIDRTALPAHRQVFALAALHAGRFTEALEALTLLAQTDDLGRRLAEEVKRGLREPTVAARAVERGDRQAVVHAAGLSASPELVRALLLRQVNYPVPDGRPRGPSPSDLPTLAQKSLTKLAFDWPTHPGARLALPDLAVQLAAPANTDRAAAARLLDAIDPNWPRLPEARRAIRGLVLRLRSTVSQLGGADLARDVLIRIDPAWARSAEAASAVPTLVGRLTPLPAAESGWNRQWFANDSAFALGPWEAADVLIGLGPVVRPMAPAVAVLLGDPGPDVRFAAAAVLSAVEPGWSESEEGRREVPGLLAATEDANPLVRRAGSQALARLVTANQKPVIRALVLALPEGEAELNRIHPAWARSPGAAEAVPVLMARLSDRDPQRRLDASLVLALLGPAARPAIPALIGRIPDFVEVSPRWRAAWLGGPSSLVVGLANLKALAAIDPDWMNLPAARQALPALLRGLPEGFPRANTYNTALELRSNIQQCIERLDAGWRATAAARKALQELGRLLRTGEPPIRQEVTGTIVWFGKGPLAAEAAHLLGHGVGDKVGYMSVTCLKALGEVGPTPAETPALVGVLAHTDYGGRDRAKLAVALLDRADGRWRESEAVRRAIPLWAAQCAAKEREARGAAVQALAWAGPAAAQAVPQLVAMLGNSDTEVLQAIKVLDALGPAAAPATRALGLRLTDVSMEVRLAAIQALGRVGRPAEALTPLLSMLHSPDPRLRREAVVALDRVDPNWAGSPAVRQEKDRWRERWQKSGGQERVIAAGVYGIAAGPETAAVVRDLLHQADGAVWEARREVMTALGMIGPPASAAVPLLAAGLKKHDERAASAWALGRIGAASRPALASLLRLAGDASLYPTEREAAWEALPHIAVNWAVSTEAEAVRTEWIERMRTGERTQAYYVIILKEAIRRLDAARLPAQDRR